MAMRTANSHKTLPFAGNSRHECDLYHASIGGLNIKHAMPTQFELHLRVAFTH
jgi:hypothetical protein